MSFSEIVLKECRGEELSYEEDAALNSDLKAWRAEVTALISKVDADLVKRKPTTWTSPEDLERFEKWKKGAIGFKLALQNKSAQLKALIHEQTALEQTRKEEESQAKREARPDYMKLLLEEVRAIRAFLETPKETP